MEQSEVEQTPSNETLDSDSDAIPTPEPSPEERALTTPRKRDYPENRRRASPLSFPKTKPSAVDEHPKKGQIEREMLKGRYSLSQIAQRYKLTPSSVQRHKKRLLQQLEHAQELQAQYRADRAKKIAGEVDALHEELFDATRKAKDEADWKGMAAVAGRALDSRKLAAEIDGIIGERGDGDGTALPKGMVINAETVQQIIAVPKKREGMIERVVDVTPHSAD